MSNIKKKEKNCKNVTLTIRCTEEDKKKLEAYAERNHLSMGSYLVKQGLSRRYVNSRKEQMKMEQLVKVQEILGRLRTDVESEYILTNTEEIFDELEKEYAKLWAY